MIVTQFLVLAAAMFGLGVFGLLVRRNIVLILLSVELMLAAVNINLVVFEAMWRTPEAVGQVFAIFVITVAAAEVAVGLALLVTIFYTKKTTDIDEINTLKG